VPLTLILVPAETVIVWSGAVFAIVMDPVAFVIETPVPAVIVVSLYPVPLPTSS
jgi:hypothetical protein